MKVRAKGPKLSNVAFRIAVLTYPRIREILGCAFATDVALSDSAARGALERSLGNDAWRYQFERELLEAFSDDQTSWSELLSNDKYEVFEADAETKARQIAASLLWEPTFPGEPVPKPNAS